MEEPTYPTPTHAKAAELAIDFLRQLDGVDAILLVNSCARGCALPTSDLDLAALVTDFGNVCTLEAQWKDFYSTQSAFRDLEGLSVFARVHLDFFDGQFSPSTWDDGGGPDAFELEIGNWLAYSIPLLDLKGRLTEIQREWLPYYSDTLRAHRFEMVAAACRLSVARSRHYANRRLHFQAFDSLYKGIQEFLQALFIRLRVYPLSYTKWLYEQLVPVPGGARVYENLAGVLEIEDFCGTGICSSIERFEVLIEDQLSVFADKEPNGCRLSP